MRCTNEGPSDVIPTYRVDNGGAGNRRSGMHELQVAGSSAGTSITRSRHDTYNDVRIRPLSQPTPGNVNQIHYIPHDTLQPSSSPNRPQQHHSTPEPMLNHPPSCLCYYSHTDTTPPPTHRQYWQVRHSIWATTPSYTIPHLRPPIGSC